MNLKQRLTALALAAALASGTLAIGAQAAFTDTTGHWAEEAIAAVAEKKLFQGTSETTFSPDIPMNRGMFVTVLGRFSESLGHKMDGSAVFSDVAADSYCASYVAWAADHGIVNGVGDGKFAPRGTVTRQQMCAIMIRFLEYLGYPMPEGAALAFEDGSAIADYAKDAISKAVALGLMQGSSTETGVVFRPAQGATRAQVAAVFLRLDRLPGIEDLKAAGESEGSEGTGTGTGTTEPETPEDPEKPDKPDEPEKPEHTDEDIVLEAEIVRILENMVSEFDSKDYIAEADEEVQDCANILLDCLRAALKSRESGEVPLLTNSYVRSTYEAEMKAFKNAYRALTNKQKDQMDRVVVQLESLSNIEKVLEYFDVDIYVDL